jgi:hypothetical protein
MFLVFVHNFFFNDLHSLFDFNIFNKESGEYLGFITFYIDKYLSILFSNKEFSNYILMNVFST